MNPTVSRKMFHLPHWACQGNEVQRVIVCNARVIVVSTIMVSARKELRNINKILNQENPPLYQDL